MFINRFIKQQQDEDVFFYFFNLSERSLKKFEKNWNRISICKSFTGKQLSQILYRIATEILYHQNDRQAQEAAIQYMADHIHTWLGQATRNLHTFDEKDFALSLWSLAVLESQFPDITLSTPYNFLRAKSQPRTFVDERSVKQARDSELWFFGKSWLKNPRRKGVHGPSEDRLMQRFEEAGIMTFRGKKSPVPSLRKAIDFTAVHFDWGEAFPELDGDGHFLDDNPGLYDFDDITEIVRNSEALRYNVNTLFRAALKSRLAPDLRILHIDYLFQIALDAEKLKEPKERTDIDLLRTIFKRLTTLPPGSYRARMLVDGHITSMIPQPKRVFKPAAWGQLPHPPLYEDGNVELLVPHDRPRLLSPESLRPKTLAAQ